MEVYIFLPLYNVQIESSILNKDFNSFSIITSNMFISKYKSLINKNYILDDLLTYIKESHKIEINRKKSIKYLLVKKKVIQDKTKIGTLQKFKKNFKIEFDNFILLARILKRGRLQINNIYFFSHNYSSCFKLKNSSNIDNNNKILKENDYVFTKTLLTTIVKNLDLIKIFDNEKLLIPITYLLQYYNTNDLFDRIIKLSIILESTMLTNCTEKLKHKLRTRTCYFLQKNTDKILSIFYDIRSSIVHNGYIGASLYKRIKNTLDYKYETDIEILFYFIQNEIEAIVREVLYKSLCIFNTSTTINNYSDLVSEIDKNILSNSTI